MINIKQIHSIDNFANMFTKALPTSTCEKIVYIIRICHSKKLSSLSLKGAQSYKMRTSTAKLDTCASYSFFLRPNFVTRFLLAKVFNETVLKHF